MQDSLDVVFLIRLKIIFANDFQQLLLIVIIIIIIIIIINITIKLFHVDNRNI